MAGTFPALLRWQAAGQKPVACDWGIHLDDFSNETATWLEDRIGFGAGQGESTSEETGEETELEIGSLIAAASDWTEDEMELDDLVVGLVESGRIQIQIGSDERID